MQPVHLHRVNAEANMARFYCVDIAPTLFGEVSVLRSWGLIGMHGRSSVETWVTPAEAETAAAQTLRQKVLRGYVVALRMLLADLPG
jgi:predicted DNA-binding WGR domain protein